MTDIKFVPQAPQFKLYLGPSGFRGEGTEAQEDIMAFVVSVEFEENVYSASKLTINIVNQDFRFTDSNFFREGNEIELHGGYGGDLQFIGRGFVRRIESDFPADGFPTMTVTCLGAESWMMEGHKSREDTPYKNSLASTIAKHIIGQHGYPTGAYKSEIQNTDVRRNWVQRANVSDYAFLRQLAKIHDFDFWVDFDKRRDDWVGYFRRVTDFSKPLFNFVYGRELAVGEVPLISFSPQYSSMNQPSDIKIISTTSSQTGNTRVFARTIPKRKKQRRKSRKSKKGRRVQETASTVLIDAQTSHRDKVAIKTGDWVTFESFGRTFKFLTLQPFTNARDAKLWAFTLMQRGRRDFLHGSGLTIGNPYIRARQSHSVELPVVLFSGDYFLTVVRHRFNGEASGEFGYMTQFESRKVIDLNRDDIKPKTFGPRPDLAPTNTGRPKSTARSKKAVGPKKKSSPKIGTAEATAQRQEAERLARQNAIFEQIDARKLTGGQ